MHRPKADHRDRLLTLLAILIVLTTFVFVALQALGIFAFQAFALVALIAIIGAMLVIMDHPVALAIMSIAFVQVDQPHVDHQRGTI